MHDPQPEIVDGVPRCTDKCPLIRLCDGDVSEYYTCSILDETAPGVLCEPAIRSRIAKLEALARAAENYVPWLCDSWPRCDCRCAPTCEDRALLDALAALKEE